MPIDEFREVAFGMVEPRYEPCAEHAGIHGNPESSNHQAPSHGYSQWRYLSPEVLIITSKRVGDEGATSTNGTQSKLHVLTQLGSKTRKPYKTPYKTPPSMVALKIGSSQTLPKTSSNI